MRRTANRPTPVRTAAGLAAAVLVVACGNQAPSEEDLEEPTGIGVATTGEQIVFAGPGVEREARARGRSEREEEELIREPNSPDPEDGDFTLEEAVAGLPIEGSLVAEFGTPFGAILCDLFADEAPNTVANFIGLARGTRPWWDARAGDWVRRPYYRGLPFHRVIPGYLVQTGDYLGDGTGTVGYTIPDEPHDTLSHDRAGQLAMANADGPNSAGAQIFFTDGSAPQLDADGMYTIFGQCRPQHVISQIARVPQLPDSGNKPLTPIALTRVLIRRVEGGAAQAQPTQPQLPPGEPEVARQASPGPSELRGKLYPGRRDRPIETPYGRPSPIPRDGTRRGPLPPPGMGRFREENQ